MIKKFLILMVLFSLLIPLTINASTLNVTFIPENTNQEYIVHIYNLNNTFNETYYFYGNSEITNLTKGIYYITITSNNYNNINIELNLTQNTTLELYFSSNIIGYGIQNYDYLIFTFMLIIAIFGLLIIMVYFMKGVRLK